MFRLETIMRFSSVALAAALATVSLSASLDLPAGRPRGRGWRLDPAADGTDGFFVARLTAPC